MIKFLTKNTTISTSIVVYWQFLHISLYQVAKNMQDFEAANMKVKYQLL